MTRPAPLDVIARPAAKPRQRGVALIVVLMFLLAITSIAVFSARYALFGEGLARNQLDHEVARQAAEAALRDAERDLRLAVAGAAPATAPACQRVQPWNSQFADSCPQGLCLPANYRNLVWQKGAAASAGTSEPWWPTAYGGKWNNTFPDGCSFNGAVPLGRFTGGKPIGGVAHQPEYFIERLDLNAGKTKVYRITARGFGYSERTQVVLQTYFRPPEDS